MQTNSIDLSAYSNWTPIGSFEPPFSGLVGNEPGSYLTVGNCYYDKDTSQRNDTGKGTPKSTADMKKQATFSSSETAYSVSASVSNQTPVVGTDAVVVTLTVKDALGDTDTLFSGAHTVCISQISAAPCGSYGSINGNTVEDGFLQTEISFTNGVGSFSLVLHNAQAQNIRIELFDVTYPLAYFNITPKHSKAASFAITQNISAPAVNCGNFAVQP
jgi:hypothetical protein